MAGCCCMGVRLGALRRLGHTRYTPARGAGYWDYLPKVSAWTVPGREEVALCTYATAGVDITDHMPDVRPQ